VDLHVPAGATALDRQLQQYVRTTAPRGRDTAQIGPFLATFHPTDPLPYLSYAIPDDDARPGAADVAALVAAYERHDRLPRLEFLPGAAPAVEAALLHAGFVVEARLPAMVCTPQQLVVPTLDAGLVLAVPAGDGVTEIGVTTAFLTPGDDGAHRAYQRAGFADATVMLHISRPASDDAAEDARGADAATE
jgi:hypothetical protein